MKKINQNGVVHHFALIVIGVLVVAVSAYAGYRIYKGQNGDSANAAGGQITYGSDSVTVCKRNKGQGKYDVRFTLRHYNTLASKLYVNPNSISAAVTTPGGTAITNLYGLTSSTWVNYGIMNTSNALLASNAIPVSSITCTF